MGYLVGNALKFTGRGSVMLCGEPAPGGAAGWLRFNVVDPRIGIAAADTSTTRKHGETGLGLAGSKSLVELMGGRIGCINEVRKGSRFFLTAPFDLRREVKTPESAEPAAVAIPPVGPAAQAATRILIVEDSECNIAVMKAYLKNGGFVLDFAENGQIAVEKATSGSFHLVLMDIQMPVMDGLDATRAIRQWEAETHAHPVPILALTAHAAAAAVEKSMEAGCTEHLTKPIKRVTLLEAISRHIAGEIHITPRRDIASLVPRYLTNVRRDMDEILADLDSKDYKIARRLGHHFKETGEAYGFPEITRTGAAVEWAALAADREEIRSQILALATFLDDL